MNKLLIFLMSCSLLFTGCSSNKNNNDFKIGIILPLTGEMAKYGKTISTASKMAVDEINSTSNGPKIKLVFEDDRIEPSLGVAAANKLINIDKVDVIIGPYASSVALAVAPIAEKNKIVMLSPGASSPKLTKSGEYIFRNCVSDVYEGSEMAKFVFNTLKLKKLAILNINNDFGNGLKKVFEENFVKLGGEILVSETYEQNNTDFRTQLLKIKSKKPQAIYLIGYEEMVRIFKQSKEIKYTPQWLATTMLNDQSLIDKIGFGMANGTVFASWKYSPNSKDPKILNFVKQFNSEIKGKLEPDVFAANTYDAIYIIYSVFTSVKSKEDLKNGILNIKEFDGITGKTSFDENGDVNKPIVFRTIINNKIIDFN
jgi:branched-chain amino acid transport system substrate-binding protein